MNDAKSDVVEEETWLDKSDWGDGPWQNEPDRYLWSEGPERFPCLIRRHPSIGSLCGYVAVPPGHPLHGVSSHEVPAQVAGQAHYSLNFSGPCMDAPDVPRRELVCHIPQPGEPDDVWWFGFDCGHVFDRTPGLDALQAKYEFPISIAGPRDPGTYRDFEYVRQRCKAVAAELEKLSDRGTPLRRLSARVAGAVRQRRR